MFGRWFPLRSPKPTVPDGTRLYVIGDVHGRRDLLEALFLNVDADLSKRPVPTMLEIMLGDYVDRGNDSKGVIDLILKRSHSGRLICLRGNHEQLLLNFLVNPSGFETWKSVGALETLVSYGVAPTPAMNPRELQDALLAAIPAAHRSFLESLRLSFTMGDYFFAHAGVQPGVSLDDQDPHDLLWIRGDFLNSDASFGKVVVHGHTPVLQPDVRTNRINIDTGAYATNRLSCLVLEGSTISFLS
jgi:serine/threonine protein phosphatase 1